MMSFPRYRGTNTWGGVYCWTDLRVAHGWRIQKHQFTGECRLLDPEDRHRVSGGLGRCLTAFVAATGHYGRTDRHAVVLVHALASSRGLMRPMERRLKAAGYRVESFGYASTLGKLESHAKALNDVLSRLNHVDSVSFVTVSLGARVVGTALALAPVWRARIEVRGLAMVCPPNRPVTMARIAKDIPPVRWVFGPVLEELAAEETPLDGLAGIPILIVAGEVKNRRLYPFIGKMRHDGVVCHEETLLDLPHSHVTVPARHGFMASRPDVQDAVLGFLDKAGAERASASPPSETPGP